MSTVNSSVPEEVKQVFNETFEGQNKSAIIANLMLDAVKRAHSRERSLAAYKRILKRRPKGPVVTQARVRSARDAGRP